MNHCSRSPGWRSQLNAWFFRCSRRMPPWPWTIGFGRPVVPDEKRTYSGCSNGSASNASGPLVGEQLVPRHRVRQRVVLAADVGHVDDGPERRQPRSHLRHLLAAVDELVAVAVAGDGEQHRRLELAEPVEHAPRAELRRARRPDGAEARRGEEGDERLRDVREVRDDAVAALHAELAAGRRAPAPPARGGRRTSARSARASASARRPRTSRRPRRGRPCARRS